MNPQNYTINIRPGWGISPVVKVSQGDVGRPLAFTIMDGQDALTIASGTAVTLKGTKPSTLGFTQACELSGNTASVETTATMTQEAGAVQAELILTQGTTVIGSANFVMYVEPAAHPEGTTDGDAETARDLMTRAQAAVEQAEAEADRAEDAAESVSQTGISTVGATAGQVPTANGAGGWSWQDPQGVGGGTSDDIENSSSVTGTTVSDALDTLSDEIANKLTTAQINALNGMFQVCAYAEDATAEYATFCEAFGLATLTSITAVYTQSGLVYDTDTLDSLKSDLVVTAHYSDSTTETLASSAYTLSGTLSAGTSTITVSYSGQTTTFSVTVEYVLYRLTNVDFTESTTGIDTGVNLLTEDTTFTIVGEITREATVTKSAWRLLQQMPSASPWNGLLYTSYSASNTNAQLKWISSSITLSDSNIYSKNFYGTHRFVFRHEKDSGTMDYFLSNNGATPTTGTLTCAYSNNNCNDLYVGASESGTSYSSEHHWNSLTIYSTALSNDYITSFLAGE